MEPKSQKHFNIQVHSIVLVKALTVTEVIIVGQVGGTKEYMLRPCLVHFICKCKKILRENFINLKY